MYKSKIISVPKTKAALDRLDYDSTIEGDLFEILLTEDDFDYLWDNGIIQKINEITNILLSDFEDDKIIDMQKIKNVISFLSSETEKSNKQVLMDLKNLFKKALKCGTGVFFYF